MTQDTALNTQVGGSHYKQGGIQPFQLSMANDHDGCIHAVQKYLTRFRLKHGILDLQKAHHICRIRLETIMEFGTRAARVRQISINDYIESNGVSAPAAAAIRIVEGWHNAPYLIMAEHQLWNDKARKAIRQCASQEYPETYDPKDFI